MRLARFRALSIGALVLSATVVGGLATTTTASAAPAVHANVVHTDLAAQVRAASAHGKPRVQHRTTQRTADAAADDSCFTSYPDNPDNPESSVRVAERLSGPDRYAVGVCVSYNTWFDYNDTTAPPDWVAHAVVLARGDIYPDALAGGPLAAQVQGPMMLTKSTTLLPNVQAEIQRVLAPGGKVYLLGSTASVSLAVESKIKSLGYNPVRIGGADRYEVAVNVAKAMPATNLFFITNGLDYPDALSAGTAAAVFTKGARDSEDTTDVPVAMLFTKGTSMPAATKNFALQRLSEFNNYWGLYTAGRAGDTATVNAFGADNIVSRYVGADRYQVATMIAADFFVGDDGKLLTDGFGMADGLNFPDALTGSGLLAQVGAPLLLTSPTKLSGYTGSFLRTYASAAPTPAYIDVFGGPSSVSDSVMIAARTAFTPTA